jgi:hypothetical protein
MDTNSWLYVAYGAGLFYLLLHPEHVRRPRLFRLIWILYCVPLVVQLLPRLIVELLPHGRAYEMSTWWVSLADLCIPVSLFILLAVVGKERPAAP